MENTLTVAKSSTQRTKLPSQKQDSISAFISMLELSLYEEAEKRTQSIVSLEEAFIDIESERLDILRAKAQNRPAIVQFEHFDLIVQSSLDYIDCCRKGLHAS